MLDTNVQRVKNGIRIKFAKNTYVSDSIKQKLINPKYNELRHYWTVSEDQEQAVIAWVQFIKKELILIKSRELDRENEEILQEIKIELKLDQEMLDEIEAIKVRTAVLKAN